MERSVRIVGRSEHAGRSSGTDVSCGIALYFVRPGAFQGTDGLPALRALRNRRTVRERAYMSEAVCGTGGMERNGMSRFDVEIARQISN